jgi:hypothetical protein
MLSGRNNLNLLTCAPEVLPLLLLPRLGPPMLLFVLNRPMTLARAPATDEVRATGTEDGALRARNQRHTGSSSSSSRIGR